MSRPCIIVVDQGTSATKGFLFDEALKAVSTEKIRHTVNRPQPGWVECDATEILSACQTITDRMVEEAQSQSLTVAAVGMAFQRSTFLFWNRSTGEPLAPAMSWQDSRADRLAKEMSSHSDLIQQQTGIPLTGHFGGPKYLHTVRTDNEIKNRTKQGRLLFGTLSSFVTHRLTGNFFIDQSIAGRSLLMNITTLQWEEDLMKLFEVGESCLPEIVPTCHNFGTVNTCGKAIPLLCIMGDQQASLIGQGRWNKGDVAMNFGTSGSVLVNNGQSPAVVPSLLTNVLTSTVNSVQFLLEGTINSVGSLFRWLEEHLVIPHEEMAWDSRCNVETEGILVPGLNGISAPYWTGEFDTELFGFGDDAKPNHYVRAAMESIGFLVRDISEVIREETNVTMKDIIASGGSSRAPLLQFISDLLCTDVYTTQGRDMTALGVARLVAHSALGQPLGEVMSRDKVFQPIMSERAREKKMSAWHEAVRKLGILKNN
ncbi:MAG: FGGY family carbohydrate kinase [Candidatus Neomarinimicrobiota bacterium]|nr:FGGY family carbohydrate kinase [Candidatus Neomarinimicrobiota bacterium]